jgi:hypothetical protein
MNAKKSLQFTDQEYDEEDAAEQQHEEEEHEEDEYEEEEEDVIVPITFSAAQDEQSSDESGDDEVTPHILKPSTTLQSLHTANCLPDPGTQFRGIGQGVMRSIPGVVSTFKFLDSTYDFLSNEDKASALSSKYSMSAVVSKSHVNCMR